MEKPEKHTRNVCANYVRMVDRWRCFLESCWTGRRHWRWTNMCVRFTWAWRLLLLLLDLPPQKTWQRLLMDPRRIPLKPRNDRSSARASSQTRDRCFSTTRGVLDCTSVSFTHSRPQSLSHQALSLALILSGHFDRIISLFLNLIRCFKLNSLCELGF